MTIERIDTLSHRRYKHPRYHCHVIEMGMVILFEDLVRQDHLRLCAFFTRATANTFQVLVRGMMTTLSWIKKKKRRQ